MVGKSVLKYASGQVEIQKVDGGLGTESDKYSLEEPQYSPVEVVTALCLVAGIVQVHFFFYRCRHSLSLCLITHFIEKHLNFQLVMYLLRLGIISTLLSDVLVSGFTTGAGIHVLVSQIKDILGIRLTPVTTNFKIIWVIQSKHKPIVERN